MKLPPASRKLLADMAAGAKLFAALREPADYMRDGCIFSESVGCRVWKNKRVVRRVRSKTVEPLYEAELIAHELEASGDRTFEITTTGRAVVGLG